MALQALWDVTQQYNHKNGSILTSGKIYIYYQGRTALATTYNDEDGTVVNSNPVLLDNNGRATAFASSIYSYTIVVCDYYGKELFSQDITLHDAISTAEDVVVTGTDGSVSVDRTELPNGVQYDLSVNTDIIASKKYVNDEVDNLQSQIDNKKDKQTALTFDGAATKTVKKITQDANGKMNVEFEEIDLPPEVPNVEIISEDKSIQVKESTDTQTNTKTFDLSVNVNDPLEYGQFKATNVTTKAQLTKIKGNLELDNYSIKLKKGNSYHFTVRGHYVPDRATNTATTISYVEYSSLTPIQVNVDNTITSSQYFEISYDVYDFSQNGDYNVSFSSMSGKVSELWVEVHNLNGVSVNGGSGGSGDNDKVAVDANAEPNYLENVLVSDSDIVSLVKLGNVLHVQVNTASTADPKLYTCDEAVINGATGNYGSYALANGYDKLVWDDPSSYSWLNASAIQMKRLCTSQGTVTKCNLAICGSLAFTSPPPFINCGIFSTDGTLLGSTGLRLYGTDFFSGSELVSFDMSEVNTGDLNLRNNTYYIIQIITCGLQLAALSHADSYNYTYDHDLKMNLEGATTKASWSNINDLTGRAAQIPWISFAASPSV